MPARCSRKRSPTGASTRFERRVHIAAVEDVVGTTGRDWWSYGIERNRAALSTFLPNNHEQGLSQRPRDIAKLFARESLESLVI